MSLNPIRRFVETETVGGMASITRILYCLRVNNNQRGPSTFFLLVPALDYVVSPAIGQTPLHLAIACSANRPSSRGVNPSVNPPSYTHSSVGTEFHQ
jgi:hypothetical protein